MGHGETLKNPRKDARHDWGGGGVMEGMPFLVLVVNLFLMMIVVRTREKMRRWRYLNRSIILERRGF